MEICVCGWYFRDAFMNVLKMVNDEFPVTVVANRDKLPDEYKGAFEYHVRENTGLEYGAYDWFIKNAWKGGDVLFMHDDMLVFPVMIDFELKPPNVIFRTISKFKDDLVYIFNSQEDERKNFSIHGRVMFASSRFIDVLLSRNGGFPWDEKNDGYTYGPNPGYCKDFNWAVAQLKEFWDPLQMDGYEVAQRIMPSIAYEYRGGKTVF